MPSTAVDGVRFRAGIRIARMTERDDAQLRDEGLALVDGPLEAAPRAHQHDASRAANEVHHGLVPSGNSVLLPRLWSSRARGFWV
jgi:hypothetical protein